MNRCKILITVQLGRHKRVEPCNAPVRHRLHGPGEVCHKHYRTITAERDRAIQQCRDEAICDRALKDYRRRMQKRKARGAEGEEGCVKHPCVRMVSAGAT